MCKSDLGMLRTSKTTDAMALSAKLSGDEQGVIFVQLCNVLDPSLAVALGWIARYLLLTWA